MDREELKLRFEAEKRAKLTKPYPKFEPWQYAIWFVFVTYLIITAFSIFAELPPGDATIPSLLTALLSAGAGFWHGHDVKSAHFDEVEKQLQLLKREREAGR